MTPSWWRLPPRGTSRASARWKPTLYGSERRLVPQVGLKKRFKKLDQLVDGGIVNNMPVDVVKSMGANVGRCSLFLRAFSYDCWWS